MSASAPSAFVDYQTDVLFLLVGANPLPNYVSALLLAKEGASVYLLHTESEGNALGNTLEVAVRLKRKIEQKRQSLKVMLSGIHDSDGEKIKERLNPILSEIDSPQKLIGLNYTGGTKPMSVHSYHAIKERFPNGCFSYLDPRTQKMFLRWGDGRTQTPLVGRAVELTLEDLLDLHGYKLSESPPRRSPKHIDLCRTLVRLHSTPEGFKTWREWAKRVHDKETNLIAALSQNSILKPVYQNLSDLCCTGAPGESEVACKLGYKNLGSCLKFLCGEFLEEYSLDALVQISEELGIAHYGIALQPRKRGKNGDKLEMELDVAAMVGYRLFAVSCMATDASQNAKDHLMELFVRARQLGGDEARFGLICCLKNPERLQQEVEQTWDAEGKIKVFGQRHLPDLPRHMRDWFVTANRGML
jgi:hypothetical protein